MQVLYGLLVQHFAMLAGERPVPKQHLDVLLGILLELTSEVPFYAATVARARITKMHERLSQALADPLSESHYGWPGARQLLQCMLFATLFPVSDRRHPVITPLALLLGKWLMQCPVPGPYEAALGLAVCGVALHMAAPAQRFMPEVQVYLTNLFNSFLPVGDKGSSTLNAGGLNAQGVNLFTPGVLSGVNSTTAQSNGSRLKQQAQHQQHKPGPQTEQVETSLPKLDLYSLLSCDPADLGVHSQEFRHKLLGCALATASRAADISAATADAVPEILAPLASAVAALADVSDLHRLAPHISSVANELQQVIQDATKHRTPMVQSFRVKATLPREYNPRCVLLAVLEVACSWRSCIGVWFGRGDGKVEMACCVGSCCAANHWLLATLTPGFVCVLCHKSGSLFLCCFFFLCGSGLRLIMPRAVIMILTETDPQQGGCSANWSRRNVEPCVSYVGMPLSWLTKETQRGHKWIQSVWPVNGSSMLSCSFRRQMLRVVASGA